VDPIRSTKACRGPLRLGASGATLKTPADDMPKRTALVKIARNQPLADIERLHSRQNVDFVRPFSERQSAVERARRKNFRNLKKTVARSETYSFLTCHGHLLSSGCLSSSRLEKRHTSEALANSSGPLFVRSVSSPISRPPSSTRGSAFRERLLFIAFK
jgi:hypothetical protein